MKYLIGEIIEDIAKQEQRAFRRYALERGMSENEFFNIRRGKRAASAKKLAQLIDTEILREPLVNYINENINSLDTDVIIEMYNVIYNKVELGKYEIDKDKA